MAIEPSETGRCRERPRDVTNRIRFFPGPATVAEFLSFYSFSRLCFIFPMNTKVLDRDRLDFPPAPILDDDGGILPRKERDRDTVARLGNANHLELGNRKRTILFPPNRSLNLSSLELTTRSGCPATEAEFLCFCFAFFL